MKLRMRALLILLLAGQVASAASPNICLDSKAREHLTSSKNQVSLPDFLKSAALSRVTLFGEIHFTSPGLRARLINQLAPLLGPKSCLFYELDHTLTIEQKLREFREPGFERNLAQFSEMHAAAVKSGLREYLVDTEFSWERLDDETTDSRNVFMTEKIAKAMKDCPKAVMFVGKAHATEDAPKQPTLQERLRTRGFTVTAVNLQETREEKEITAPLASWNNACPKGSTLPAVDEAVAVRTGDLAAQLKLLPKTKSPAKWRDFDWVLLVP